MEVSQSKTHIGSPTRFLKSLALFLIGTSFIIFAFTYPNLTIYMRWATLSYLCMVSGLYFRKERIRHLALMGLAIFSDLSLVLLLEFQRSAIKTAVSFSLTLPQQLHIGFSTLAVLFYFPVVGLGIARVLQRGSIKTYQKHRILGMVAFAFRTLGFVLMFSLLK